MANTEDICSPTMAERQRIMQVVGKIKDVLLFIATKLIIIFKGEKS